MTKLHNLNNASTQSNYNGIDIVKFFMALCVIMIHVMSFFVDFNPGQAVNFIITQAVPFFFIASGFLLCHKMNKCEDHSDKTSTILKYSQRIWKMYFSWILIYVPLCILGEWVSPSEPSWSRFIMVQVRSALLLGEIRFSYPTWYLFSLGIATSTIYLFTKRHFNLSILFSLGIVGILLQYITPFISDYKPLLMMASRITIGLGYILCGMYLYNNRRFINVVSCIVLLAVAILLFCFELPFSETTGSIALFVFALMITGIRNISVSLWMRRQSLWIYLTHMYILTPLCLFAVIKEAWASFWACAIICIIISQILISISDSRYGSFLKRLI